MAGPDGNLWFAEGFYPEGLRVIGRITPAGAIAQFPLPASIFASALTFGPDGNLWFSELIPRGKTGVIGRITPAGAVTQFPLPAGSGSPNSLAAGPDGNLWFTEGSYAIGRITPAGAVTQFPLPAGSGSPGSLMVGPDGNLWFVEGLRAIGRVDPTPPRVSQVIAIPRQGKAITSILLVFDEALDPGSAATGGFYSLAAGIKRGRTIVFSKAVKIVRASYDGPVHRVRLKLARAQKGPVRVTVRAGLVAADGMSSSRDFTAVVA
jgi:streptogramin lyase